MAGIAAAEGRATEAAGAAEGEDVMGVKVRDDPPGSGVWFIFVNHKGKRFAKKVGGDKRVANQIAKEVERQLAKGDLGLLPKEESTVPTVETYSERFLASIEHTLKFTTYTDYETNLRLRILPALGPKRLDQLTRQDIKEFALGLRRDGTKARNARKTIATLSSLLSEAVDDGHMEANPAAGLKKVFRSPEFKAGETRRSVNPLTREELAHLLTTADTHAIERAGKTVHPYRAHGAFLLLLARTGLRLGEAIAVRWGDLDRHSGFLEVHRACVRGRITTPKNKKSRRVDLSTQLRDTLADLWANRFERFVAIDAEAQAALEAKRATALDAYVFSEGERPMDPDNFRRRIFEPLLTIAKMRRCTIKDLRHTYASQMIAAGKELHYIQEQLGHHSPAFTLSVYGHLLPRNRRGEVDCLDDQPGSFRKPAASTISSDAELRDATPQPVKIAGDLARPA